MDEQKKACDDVKALYQAVCQLRIHWSDVIVRNIHYAIILIMGIWGLLGNAYIESRCEVCCYRAGKGWYLFVAALLSSIVIVLWRWYSHYLDKAIINIYPEIVKYEAKLGAKDEGVWIYLIKNVLGKSENQELKDLTEDQKKKFVEELVQRKQIGCRGHNTFDIIGLVCIVLMWIISVSLSHCWQLGVWSTIGLFSSVGFLGLIFCIYRQKNPSDNDIKNAISKAKSTVGETHG